LSLYGKLNGGSQNDIDRIWKLQTLKRYDQLMKKSKIWNESDEFMPFVE